MDTQLDSQSASTVHEPSSRKKRFLLFSVTYILSAVILAGVMEIRFPNSAVSFLSNFVGAIIFLPVGLFYAVVSILEHTFGISIDLNIYSEYGNKISILGASSSYLLLFGIVRAGTLTRNIRNFRILYCISIGLLIMNIVGCAGV